MFNADVLERGKKAVEGFYPKPYEEVDKTLREATKRTGDNFRQGLKEMMEDSETNYA